RAARLRGRRRRRTPCAVRLFRASHPRAGARAPGSRGDARRDRVWGASDRHGSARGHCRRDARRFARLEYALLLHLPRDPARVYTKDELMRDVWGFRSPGTTRTLDSHASRLRQALARAGAEGWVRVTRGVGYRLAPDLHLEPCLTERRGHGFTMPRRHRVL